MSLSVQAFDAIQAMMVREHGFHHTLTGTLPAVRDGSVPSVGHALGTTSDTYGVHIRQLLHLLWI